MIECRLSRPTPEVPSLIYGPHWKKCTSWTKFVGCIKITHNKIKVTIRPGFSRTVLYFWLLSRISRCAGFEVFWFITT